MRAQDRSTEQGLSILHRYVRRWLLHKVGRYLATWASSTIWLRNLEKVVAAVAAAARGYCVCDVERRALPVRAPPRCAEAGPQGPAAVASSVAPLLGSKRPGGAGRPSSLSWKRNGQDARRHPQHPPQISEEVGPSEGRKSSVYMGLQLCFLRNLYRVVSRLEHRMTAKAFDTWSLRNFSLDKRVDSIRRVLVQKKRLLRHLCLRRCSRAFLQWRSLCLEGHILDKEQELGFYKLRKALKKWLRCKQMRAFETWYAWWNSSGTYPKC